MPVHRVNVFSCDRCGTTVNSDQNPTLGQGDLSDPAEPRWQPSGWYALYATSRTYGLSEADLTTATKYLLCNLCAPVVQHVIVTNGTVTIT